jgi:hypothetical protein
LKEAANLNSTRSSISEISINGVLSTDNFFLTVYLSKQDNDNMYKTGRTTITSPIFFEKEDDILKSTKFTSIKNGHYIPLKDFEKRRHSEFQKIHEIQQDSKISVH